MLDLSQYNSLGAALRAALDRWPDEICLIEADRERENARLTYRQFKEAALPLARALQDAGLQSGTRAAIIMTNQSKWLISAYAIFFGGGVLVPLDYKLTADEQLKLLAHSKAEFLVIEYHLWRAIAQAQGFKEFAVRVVLVTEAPGGCRTCGRKALGGVPGFGRAGFCRAQTQGRGVHRLFVGNGRAAEGLRPDARELPRAVRRAHVALSFLARRALSEHSADEPRDRFHGGLHRTVRLRRDRGPPAHAATGVHSRRLHALQDHVHEPGADGAEESRARPAAAIRRTAERAAENAERADRHQPRAHAAKAESSG